MEKTVHESREAEMLTTNTSRKLETCIRNAQGYNCTENNSMVHTLRFFGLL